jgi:hypothetical protein
MRRIYLSLLLASTLLAGPAFPAFAITAPEPAPAIMQVRTRIIDCIQDVGGNSRKGIVTFILTKPTTTPGGIAPAAATVSARLNAQGYFDVSIVPSAGLSPQQYYQVWFSPSGTTSRGLLGVYNIPAPTSTVTLAPYEVTDTAPAARYSFASEAAVTGLIENVSGATLEGITAENINSALGYPPDDASRKGRANGHADLDRAGKEPLAQLPPTAARIRSVEVDDAAPADGRALVFDQAAGKFRPGAVAEGEGGGGPGGLASGLVSYWKMEETSGNRADAAGANTLVPNVALTAQPGKVGLAPDFYDAAARLLSVADNPSLNFSGKSLTISAWAWQQLATASTQPAVVSKLSDDNAPASNDFVLYWDKNVGRFAFRVSNGTGLTTVTAAAPTPGLNTWYHLLAWHDKQANTVNLQVNGGEVYSAAHTGGVNHTGAPLRVAAWNGQRYWTGAVDEVGIWERALTAAEREKLYNAGAGLTHPFEDTASIVERTYTYNIKTDFKASGSAQTTTCSVSSGSKTLSCTDAKDFKVGQGVLVPGAGALSPTNDLVTTITAVDGLNFTLAAPAANTASGVTVQHDETAAVQASLNACYASGGCDVYWPRGVYNVEGPVQGGTNSILYFPLMAYGSPASTYSVRWRGETVPRLQDHNGLSPAWTTLISKRRAGSGPYPALLAALAYDASVSLNNFNFVNPVMENFYVRTKPNPSLTMFQFQRAANVTVRNVMMDTGNAATFNEVAEPTNNQAVAVYLPAQNNRSRIRVEDTSVSGFYTGFRFSEATTFGGQVVAAYGKDCFVREQGYPFTEGVVWAAECRRGLVNLSTSLFTNFTIHNEAYNPGGPEWFAASATDYFSDAGGSANGRVLYSYWIAGPGSYGTPGVSGWNNTTLCNFGTGQCKRGAGAPFSF